MESRDTESKAPTRIRGVEVGTGREGRLVIQCEVSYKVHSNGPEGPRVLNIPKIHNHKAGQIQGGTRKAWARSGTGLGTLGPVRVILVLCCRDTGAWPLTHTHLHPMWGRVTQSRPRSFQPAQLESAAGRGPVGCRRGPGTAAIQYLSNLSAPGSDLGRASDLAEA